MNSHLIGRRDFFRGIGAVGLAGLPAAVQAGRPVYDPTATFGLTVFEVEMRRNAAGLPVLLQLA